MYKVSLNDLVFYANHGMYSEETLTGNRFIVNVSVYYQSNQKIDEHLNRTVDYEILAQIVSKRMALTSSLLETIVEDIIYEVKDSFPFIEKITVSLQKENPPLGLNCRSSEVSLTKNFNAY